MNTAEIIALIEKLLAIFLSTPVIILVIVLLFRKHIFKLLRIIEKKFASQDFEEFELGTSGVKAKFIKAETSLGETKITVPKVQYDPADDNLLTYTSGQYKFRIGWNEKLYEGSTEKAHRLAEEIKRANGNSIGSNIVFVIEAKKSVSGFLMNVNVVAEVIEKGTSIFKYVHSNIQQIESIEIVISDSENQKPEPITYKVFSSNVDENSQSGLIEYRSVKHNLFQFAKLVVNDDLGYTITATVGDASLQNPATVGESFLNAEIRTELKTILNSFQLIRIAPSKSK